MATTAHQNGSTMSAIRLKTANSIQKIFFSIQKPAADYAVNSPASTSVPIRVIRGGRSLLGLHFCRRFLSLQDLFYCADRGVQFFVAGVEVRRHAHARLRPPIY